MHKAQVKRASAPSKAIKAKVVAKKHQTKKISTKTRSSTTQIASTATTFAPLLQSKAPLPKPILKTPRRFFSGSYPSHEILTFSALSPTMERGKIASWEKKIGQKINVGDAVCQIVTDKATVSFDATDEGYLAKILIEAGDDDIEVGQPIAVVAEDESDVAAFANFSLGGKAAPAPTAAKPEAKSEPKPEKDISQQRSCGVYIAPESPKAIVFDTPKKSTSSSERVSASPLARVTAKELGVDLSEVTTQSGMFGSVTVEDIKNHKPSGKTAVAAAAEPAARTQSAAAVAAKPAAKAAAPASTEDGDYVDEPLSNMRKVIAQRLTQSKQTIPHYYITVEVEMDQINALRSEFNKKLAAAAGKDETPVKLSVNDFIIKASSAALKKVPAVNSSWRDTAIRRFNYCDISVAVSTDAGLITPIIADADIKGLATISAEMKSLAGKARKGTLQPHEYQGGTFTISNLGMFGVDHFSAIINPPQAAILAIGGTSEKVVVNKKYDAAVPGSQQFKPVSVMKVTASFDHRVVDGAVGAQFLASFKDFCEDPKKLLL